MHERNEVVMYILRGMLKHTMHTFYIVLGASWPEGLNNRIFYGFQRAKYDFNIVQTDRAIMSLTRID